MVIIHHVEKIMRNFEKIDNNELQAAIKESSSFRELSKRLGLGNSSSKDFNDFVRKSGFCIAHFTKSYPGNTKYKGSIGKTFNYLTVNSIEQINKNIRPNYYANCTCKCGNEIQVLMASIRNGLTKSCGCIRSDLALEKFRYLRENLPQNRFTEIKRNAKSRGYEFSVSIEYLRKLFLIQNKQCYFTGIELLFGPADIHTETTASVDRIDNRKGYIEGNVQWVHKDINKMRGEMPVDTFIKACKLISGRFND